MQFAHKKRRQAPAIIIVALIDVLIVVLIFLMVTTTFKHQQPVMNLALPESSQAAKAGSSEQNPLVVTVDRKEPFFYLDAFPVTVEKLQNELASRARENPQLYLAIRADKEAAFGNIVTVMDAAKEANIVSIKAYIQAPAGK